MARIIASFQAPKIAPCACFQSPKRDSRIEIQRVSQVRSWPPQNFHGLEKSAQKFQHLEIVVRERLGLAGENFPPRALGATFRARKTPLRPPYRTFEITTCCGFRETCGPTPAIK